MRTDWLPTRKSIWVDLRGDHHRATGSAMITLERVKGRLCFRLNWAGIGTPVAAHIHEHVDGPAACAVVPLFVDAPKRRGCVKVPKALLRKISDCPERYYVTLQTHSYPRGALRGSF
jgi:hypothetical protein